MGWSLKKMEEGAEAKGKGTNFSPSCPTSRFTLAALWLRDGSGSLLPRALTDSYLGNRGCSCSHRRTWPGTQSKAGRFCGGFSDPVAPEDRPETPSQGCHARARGPLFLF